MTTARALLLLACLPFLTIGCSVETPPVILPDDDDDVLDDDDSAADDDDSASVDDDDSAADDDDATPPVDDDDTTPEPDDDDAVEWPGKCPGTDIVELTAWDPTPWVAPTSGNAQQSFRFAADTDLHYSLLQLDFDFTTTTMEGPYTCFAELRNTGACQSCSYPWRYFAICTKNESGFQTILHVFSADDGRVSTNFEVQPNTDYHLSVTFDAQDSSATMTVNEVGGPSTTMTSSPLNSSIVPMGNGLDLLMGFTTTHPDFGTIMPPWGWTFANLTATLTPGGPFGDAAPPCP